MVCRKWCRTNRFAGARLLRLFYLFVWLTPLKLFLLLFQCVGAVYEACTKAFSSSFYAPGYGVLMSISVALAPLVTSPRNVMRSCRCCNSCNALEEVNENGCVFEFLLAVVEEEEENPCVVRDLVLCLSCASSYGSMFAQLNNFVLLLLLTLWLFE